MRCVKGSCFAGLIVLTACNSHGDALRAAAAESPAVEFTVDLWPGEGIPVIEMQRNTLPLRAAPDAASPVVDSLTGRPGQRVAFDSTRYQTVKPGAIQFHSSGTVTGRDLGLVRHLSLDLYYRPDVAEVTVPVPAQGTVELLQHRAEGTCFVRLDQRVIDAQPCPGLGRDSVEVVRAPVTRWWIGIRGAGGAFGWLIVSDSTARSVRREF